MKPRTIAYLTFQLIVLAATVAVCQEVPPPGGIRLLSGYHHQPRPGIDSKTGIISKAGGLQIHYDIGAMAGSYSSCEWCGWTSAELWRKQQVIGGQDAVLIFTKEKRLVISFPNAHANFYATVRTENEMADMLLMVLTFHPD